MENRPIVDPAALRAAEERRVSLRSSMNALEGALAARAVGREHDWAAGVSAAVAEVDSCMVAHVASTEAPGGFHEEIVTAAPRLVHAVSVSASEHASIGELIGGVRSVLDASPIDVEATREVGNQLLVKLARHRQRGGDLIFEAYQSDLGAGE